MFLLNDEIIVGNIKRPESLRELDISPFDMEFLGPTYYYFGLGPKYQRWDEEKQSWTPEGLSSDQRQVLFRFSDNYFSRFHQSVFTG